MLDIEHIDCHRNVIRLLRDQAFELQEPFVNGADELLRSCGLLGRDQCMLARHDLLPGLIPCFHLQLTAWIRLGLISWDRPSFL